jgi:hypothetical protein
MCAVDVSARVWELRVHGVGNTPPGSVLLTAGDPDVGVEGPDRLRLVTGDGVTGFYRRADDSAGDSGVVVEAYSWGRLTAGSPKNVIANWRRAGWTLLLPFALINVALWARPRIPYDANEKGTAAVAAWLVRAVALGLTCTMVLAVSGVSMDVIAWQCRPQACDGPGWIQDLLAQPFFTTGARRTLAGTAIPLIVIAGFYWLSGSSFHYEEGPDGQPQPDSTTGDVASTRLENPEFWRGSVQVRALRRVHTGAALAVVAHALAGCVWISASTLAGPSRTALIASVIAFAAIGAALAALTSPMIRARGVQEAGRRASALLWTPVVLGVTALAFAGVAAWTVGPTASSARPPFPTMPGLDGSIRVTYLMMFAALMLLMVLTWRQAERSRLLDRGADSTAWQGLATPLFAGAAWLVALVYSVCLVFGADSLMGGPDDPGHAQYAVTMQWNAVGLLAALAVSALAAAAALLHLIRVRSVETGLFRKTLNQQNWQAYRKAAEAVGRARGLHRYIGYDALGQVGWLAAGLLTVIAAGAMIAAGRDINLRLPQRHDPWDAFGLAIPDAPADWLLTPGALLATATLILLLYLGYAAHKLTLVQRTLGIVWDIITFWPRGAHPFAPPCYAEQAVPQLITRIEGTPGTPLILAGHSQGSVLCAATVAQLTPSRREQVFLLTFGTQLTRLYGRVFPAFFGHEGRLRLATLLGGSPHTDPPWNGVRWRSLHRNTDFLGWPIAATRDPRDPATPTEGDDLGRKIDCPVTDPEGLDPNTGAGLTPAPGEIARPPIQAHSNYQLTGEYLTVRNEAATQLQQPACEPSPMAEASPASASGQAAAPAETEQGSPRDCTDFG